MVIKIPEALISSLKGVKGFDEKSFIQIHESGQQVVSIRINPAKFDIQHCTFDIDEAVPWSSSGYYLKERPSFTTDPLFHAGAYYVQEASSMFLEEAIRQTCDLSQPIRVLDLCAAPGGKSTLIQSVISDESLLVSNELIKSRVNILAENMTKWGAANVVVTNNDPSHFKRLPAFFDLIVVDAPCSGSGLFRKDPAAVNEWSINNVELCCQRQQKILADIMQSLKPRGILIYSTCSYSLKEDEDIEDWLVENYSINNTRLTIKEEWGIVETVSDKHKCYGYRCYPDKLKGEGFFITVFKKGDELTDTKEFKSRPKPALINKQAEALLTNYLLHPEKYRFVLWQDEVLAFPAILYDAILVLQSALYLKKAGVKMGGLIRNELIPHHEWAISSIASHQLPSIEVDKETALQYLRRNEINLESNTSGWARITYRKFPLGLVKVLPGRTNNYYPKEWRILNK